MKIVYIVFLCLSLVNAIAMEKPKKDKPSFKFTLPLDEISSEGVKKSSQDSKLDKWQQLSFMGSASQRSVRQQFIVGLLTVGTPKKDQDPLAYKNDVLRNRTFIKHVQNPNFGFTLEEEHVRVKTLFALLEELLSHLSYHAQNNEQNQNKAKKYSEMISADKICYYKRYYYLVGEKYKKIGEKLFKKAEEANTTLFQNLCYHTSITFYKNARFFYNQSYGLKTFNPKEKEDKVILQRMHRDAGKFLNQDVLIIFKRINVKIEEMPYYNLFLEKLNETRTAKEEADKMLKNVLELREKCTVLEKQVLLSPKKKADKKELKKVVSQLIDTEVAKMDNAKVFKDKHKQIIEELVSLLKKREYLKLMVKIHEIKVSEKKVVIYEQLNEIEAKFIDLAVLYLQVFTYSPRKRYVLDAENVMNTLSEIAGYKIECNPHSIVIRDDIRALLDKIDSAYSLVDHKDDKKLFNALRKAKLRKEEAYQWME